MVKREREKKNILLENSYLDYLEVDVLKHFLTFLGQYKIDHLSWNEKFKQ